MSANFHYTMDKKGIMEIAKSPGVRATLADLAKVKAVEANGMLRSHNPDAGEHAYASRTKVLGRTAIGMVHTTGITTELDQKRHHTLDAINH